MTSQDNHSRTQAPSHVSGRPARKSSRWLGRLMALAVLVVWPLVLVGFFISSCGEEREFFDEPLMRQLGARPDRITSYDFHGLMVPGTKEDAKRLGFSDCSANDAFFYCTRPRMGKFLGVEVRAASLILDEMDNFIETRFSIQKRNPGVFSYRSIQIEFGPTFYDTDCLNKHNKERPGHAWVRLLECRKNDGIDYFKYLLQADGWVNDTSGRGRVDAYYKRGIPLEIEVGIVNGTANIRPFPLKDVELITQAQAQAASTPAPHDDSQASREKFVRSMKQ
ncbi:hypothetical protein [Rivihabitans pingtungensis]|uniref:hypothetical protein n=1 Tax=Rivihabitans pingtungensis TaxID=1054498 RepID=UPI0028A24423|nr:hypothetical protein [Rivihabitans pingtungensis]